MVVLLALPATVVLASLADGGSWHLTWLTTALAVFTWLPLLLLGPHPRWALGGTIAAQQLWSAEIPLWGPVQFTAIPVAVLVATYSVTARSPLRRGLGIAVVAGASQFLTGVALRPGHLDTTAFAVNLTAFSAGLGLLVRDRRERLHLMEDRAVRAERDRFTEARRQVNAERVRIARDLHDVLAHNIALINAQSGVAAYLLRTDPAAAEKALNDITQHSRQALDELRATVGLLRQDDPEEDLDGSEDGSEDGKPSDRAGATGPAERHPTPGLADLPALLQRYRDSGSTIVAYQHGEPLALNAQTDIAAYRIVQEALTNAAKHAPATGVEVDLTWSARALEVRVSNDTTAAEATGHRGVGTGHGLIGMRERATAAGGSLDIDRDQGTFRITAHLPATVSTAAS
ncbi:sensor histidine kinase [Kineococcus sp. R86509]|uniref:sensor histidine kinase n=1 Tax=Kineococcus sp. R86509 TaxID=3093851 RepID=UPI0036D316AD